MKHRLVTWIASISSVATALYAFIAGNFMQRSMSLSFEWNWFVLVLLTAMAANIILLVFLFRTGSKKGSLYWFAAFVVANILWLVVITIQTLSATAEQAAFFQGLLPMCWVPALMFSLFFCLTFIDDRDVPSSLTLWLSFMFSIVILVFAAGQTNVLETHVARQAEHFWWGWESFADNYQLPVFVYAVLIIMLCLGVLIKAYRHTTSLAAKRQYKIFIVGYAQYIGLIITTDMIVYELAPSLFPPLTFLYSTFMSLIVGYGIIRFGIFQINPVSLANTILQSLTEAVIGVNTQLKIEFANEGSEVIFGIDQNTLKGQSISKLMSPEMYAKVEAEIKSGKRYIEFDDTQVLNISQQQVPVTLAISQVYDEQHHLAGYILVAANISEIKKKTIELAQEKASVERKVKERTQQLSETHARLTASIDSLNLGFLMTSDTEELSLLNPKAKELLTALAEAQKITLAKEWNMHEIEGIFKAGIDLSSEIRKSRTKGTPAEFKEMLLAEHYVHVFMAPVKAPGGVIGTVVLFRDITDEKAQQRSKDEFFSIASHELRTPLSLIRGNAELVRDFYSKKHPDEEVMGMIGDIESSSTKLIQIVNDFLDMSSLEQGKMQLRVEKVDLMEIITEVADEIRNNMKEQAVTLTVEPMKAPVAMTIDRDRTRQILLNLIGNARKFTEKGSITVSVELGREQVKVRITDTGKGIDIANQGLLFRKFQQAGKSILTRDGEGTGLGLYITKLMVTAMGGTVGLEKSEVGKGSTFYFSLPYTVSVNVEPKQKPLN